MLTRPGSSPTMRQFSRSRGAVASGSCLADFLMYVITNDVPSVLKLLAIDQPLPALLMHETTLRRPRFLLDTNKEANATRSKWETSISCATVQTALAKPALSTVACRRFKLLTGWYENVAGLAESRRTSTPRSQLMCQYSSRILRTLQTLSAALCEACTLKLAGRTFRA
jgi:hypothetical protein